MLWWCCKFPMCVDVMLLQYLADFVDCSFWIWKLFWLSSWVCVCDYLLLCVFVSELKQFCYNTWVSLAISSSSFSSSISRKDLCIKVVSTLLSWAGWWWDGIYSFVSLRCLEKLTNYKNKKNMYFTWKRLLHVDFL